jgi:YYY domain-containing protein
MTSFISWYLLLTLLGWLTVPLAYRLFPALADRGYTLARTFGLLVWGYVFWLAASLGIAQNDRGGLLLGLIVLGGLSAWAFMTADDRPQTANSTVGGDSLGLSQGQHPALAWLKRNLKLVFVTELLFLYAFAFLAFFRASNPEIVGTEKPMELMMIQGVMSSPEFPPRDLWLSGYSISYYHFGYVLTAMLAKFTGVPATVAFNLMLALIFGLAAIGTYGILYNLLALRQADSGQPSTDEEHAEIVEQPSTVAPLLAPLFLLLLSNAEGFLEVLHRRGLFWLDGANFWTWLDIPELREAPSQMLGWVPDRFWWWWRASRVIMDYDLNGNWTLDVISEFPAFSFILGDLHPHVLAMPFVLLAVAFALNLFLGGWRGTVDLYFGQLHISRTGFLLLALMLGGLAFLNTWDILIGGALIVFSYALFRVREAGWGWERVEDILWLGVPALITAYVMYLPFFIGFDSQAGGVVPNFMFPTRGAQLWVMWGPLFTLLFVFLFSLVRGNVVANWRAGVFGALGLVIALLAAMFALGFVGLQLRPELLEPILASQGRTAGQFIADSMNRRLLYIGSLLTLLALLTPALALLFADRRPPTTDATFNLQPSAFALLLIVLGLLLILGPEFIYLRDNFGYRINTIFKFYYQAWIVLSLAAAYGTAVLLAKLRGLPNALFSLLFVLVLVVGLAYPVLGFFNRANGFNPPYEYTLDDFERVQRENPDEAAAMQWLRSAPDGVILEATRDAYSAYGRMSIYTGRPTVLGWSNHEGQWRDYALQGTRAQDIETIYATPDWVIAQELLKRYNVRYVIVGNLERSTYRVNEEKFNIFLKPVFQQGTVTVYAVP